jgi:hypothetical protein
MSCSVLFRRPALVVSLTAAMAALSGCSLKTAAVKTVADTLSAPGDVFSRDDDPELIRDAVPFGLKLNETLLESVPKHIPLLVTTCGAFTQYAYAYLEADADAFTTAERAQANAMRDRALNMYIRAKGYCVRGLDARFGAGTSEKLLQDPGPAIAKANKADVPLLYWTAASWGAAISLGLDRPELAIDFPTVRALADRALALDETWNNGALPELMITLDSLPEALGGNPARARDRFKRAVDIQKGLAPGPYLALALGVSIPAQDRAEFERLLKDALAIDPNKSPSTRLVTLLMQRRARVLLAQVDEKFSK